MEKNPEEIINLLENKYKFKFKVSGPIGYHLGCDFFRDKYNVLCMAPRKYIQKEVDSFYSMFGEMPNLRVWSPLEKGDHPELDTSNELDIDNIKKYQSLLGALQWMVSLGRFDISNAVMTLSKFRKAPRKGHMDRIKRIYGYIIGLIKPL